MKAGGIPTINVRDFVSEQNQREEEFVKKASALYLQQGCLLIENVFNPKYIQRLHDDYVNDYSHYFEDKTFDDALSVGNKRIMQTVEIKGSFNTFEFYANPRLLPLFKHLLSDEMILGSVGCVVSLPGAEDQHVHRDHPNIYDTEAYYSGTDKTISNGAPYAITLVIPLVPINELTGSTKVWPGSHLTSINPSEYGKTKGLEYRSELGSCFLMDYRLVHAGMANNSNAVRPILYNIYSRPWFRDHRNYEKQVPLKISEGQFSQIPNAYLPLFDWWKKEKRSH